MNMETVTLPRYDTIGVAGDWHGNTEWAIKALNRFAERGINVIVHLGDFGIWPGASGAKYIQKIQRTLERNGQTLYVVPGNHEDYTRINRTEVSEDGLQYYRPNIILLPRGYRWEWEGRSFVTLGGANSIDFEGRTEWVNWWKDENIGLGDVYRTIDGGHADVMFTHEAPSGVVPGLKGSGWSAKALRYAQESSEMMLHAVHAVKPDLFMHGHYHHYYDIQRTLNDGLEDYTTRFVGLDMDDHPNNLATLRLADLHLEVF